MLKILPPNILVLCLYFSFIGLVSFLSLNTSVSWNIAVEHDSE